MSDAGHSHDHSHEHGKAHSHEPLWKLDGVRVIGAGQLFTAVAGPEDFIDVPPFVPHQEINASATEPLECVLCRSDGEAVAVNLDIEPAEKPQTVLWIDPTHPQGGV